jgi:hypothetical protein
MHGSWVVASPWVQARGTQPEAQRGWLRTLKPIRRGMSFKLQLCNDSGTEHRAAAASSPAGCGEMISKFSGAKRSTQRLHGETGKHSPLRPSPPLCRAICPRMSPEHQPSRRSRRRPCYPRKSDHDPARLSGWSNRNLLSPASDGWLECAIKAGTC